MSLPKLELRASSPIGVLALVSVLHTSTAAYAQNATPPAAPQPHLQQPAAQPAAQSGAASPVPDTPPATVSPQSAPVDNARERARAAYTAGQDAYTAGRFAAAEEHFALADSLLPAVQAKYWRAMSLDQLGNVPAALAAFERVLESPDKLQLGLDKVANAEARQRALAATPAELVISTVPPGARVNVSGVDLSSPTPLSLRLAPGRHVVRVVLDGYQPQHVELNVTAGEKLTPTLTLVKAASGAGTAGLAAIPALGADAAERSRVPGYVTLAIAGASAVVGTIFGIQALQDKSDFDDNPTTSKADDVERNALIADMAFGVTLTLGITGIVLLVADDPVPAAPQVGTLVPQRLRVTPYVAPNGAGAAATLTF